MLLVRDSDFEIVSRPRVVDRIARAGQCPLTLILAPAGFGKSYALREFLETLAGAYVLLNATHDFDVTELPAGYYGTIAVDGLEKASEAAVAELLKRIEQTKTTTHWIVASRSSLGLPVGTWLANGDSELPVGAADLRFNHDEVERACREAGIAVDEDVVRDVLDYSEGWPVGVSLMVRAFKHSADRREARAIVRDASFEYLSEQIYSNLRSDERELLAIAAVSPDVDVRVLELAGFPYAVQTIEAIRRRTGLLHDVEDQGFAMSALLRDFLRRQTALAGAQLRESISSRAGRALESAGRVEGALKAFVAARSKPDVLRVLEDKGFDLVECGHAASVAQAIDTIDESTRSTSPRILALRGVLQSLAGKPTRAETFLRRALAHSQNDPDLCATITFRLALLLTNRGSDVTDLLLPIADDQRHSASRRSEAFSLLAARSALAGRVSSARAAAARSETLLSEVEDDAVRAKVLQRLGVAAMYAGDFEQARDRLAQSADIATDLHMFSLASRAYANLSNLALHKYDDVGWQLWYAEQAAAAATQASDAFDIETSLLQLLDAELRCGNEDRSKAIEAKLAAARAGDQSRIHYLVPSMALRLAWHGQFAEAHRVLEKSWRKLHHDVDRIVSGAECALFFAMDKKRAEALAVVKEVTQLASAFDSTESFAKRSVAMARLCCALAEAVTGRFARAERIMQRVQSDSEDAVVELVKGIGLALIGGLRDGDCELGSRVSLELERLAHIGYAHLTRLMDSVLAKLNTERLEPPRDPLTPVERTTIRLLADGLSRKEIALRRGCTVNTVRTHIANVITKLHCNGAVQAIAVSRRVGILD